MIVRTVMVGFASLLILATGLLSACGGNDDNTTPATEPAATATASAAATPTQAAFPDEVQLTDADDGTTVQLANEGTLIVALASNPTTGYSWAVSEQSDPQLVLQGEPTYVPAGSTTPVVGAGGTEVFRFKATDTGTATLTLEYRRSFEPGVPPQKTFSVMVEIR